MIVDLEPWVTSSCRIGREGDLRFWFYIVPLTMDA
jgi:hypothetical protein